MVDTSTRSKQAAETRKAHNPQAFQKMGQKGAQARHQDHERDAKLAQRAAQTRKEKDPDTFRKMGEQGG